ncbi:MAG TPA: type II toxin-antitoxin system RelE/ParE family toxin [Candidatus Binatia bacterium]
MRYDFHPEALEEYQQSAIYYAQHDPALARRFVEAVEETIQRIIESPSRWRILDGDVRRCLTRIFPFGILYAVEPDFVLIVAVMHLSREPGYWKQRVVKP